MNFLLKKIVLLCFLFCGLYAEGQVRFSASLNPSEISRDEYTTIRFVLENADNIQNITPPSFDDFILISGPLQESGMANINGAVTNYLAISFVFKTKSPGKFRIPAAVAKIAGKNYKSNPVLLVVKNARSANPNNINLPPAVQNLSEQPLNSYNDYIFKNSDNVAEKVNKNMHLRLEVNKTSCYVGEPVIATYKLYTRLKSESRLTQNPSFNGFSVVDLQAADITATSVEKLNGRDYNVYTIRKAQLYPLQDGRIDLESAELENKIQFIRESYAKNNTIAFSDIFDDFANATVSPEAVIDQTAILKSKPVTIVVKPLPEAGKPFIFKGAVGDFAIESGLEKNSFAVDKSGKLVVMISGSGNLQLVTPPVVSWPAGIEAFDPKTSDILSMTSVPVSGKKVFEYPFSVDKAGEYILPAIHFSYFDPVKHAYKAISTGKISFTVTNETAAPIIQSGVATPVMESAFYNKIYHRKWLVLIIALLILSGLVIYLKRENKRQVKEKENMLSVADASISMNAILEISSINQQNPLVASEKCLYDPECVEFYSLLMGEIKNFFSGKFSIPPEEVNKKRLAEKMDKLNISNETVLTLQQLLQDIEWQLYTPFERNEKMEVLYRRSHELLQLINTYDTRAL